jgi:hypothetical protein
LSAETCDENAKRNTLDGGILLLRVFKVIELEVRVVILLIGVELGVGVRVVSVRELLEVVTHEVDGARISSDS